MIEKIINQDSNEVHSIWIPERRSLASFIVWKAYGLGSAAGWSQGQISVGSTTDWADWPSFPEFPGYMDLESIPDWVDDYLAAVDALLPPAWDIVAAMDPDSLTVMLDPPAYRVPQSPADQDMAICLLASRILLAVRNCLILPTDRSLEDQCQQLSFASKIAVLSGSEAAMRLAMDAARSPDLFFVIPEPIGADSILVERADD
ncbi:hypothetical protein G6L37_03525 [Agrobacterium rubi]|nr:hypothetical protein [Agrobacterium rubi]NTF24442.1 hypothetical protein [Agrobacterium rubi]